MFFHFRFCFGLRLWVSYKLDGSFSFHMVILILLFWLIGFRLKGWNTSAGRNLVPCIQILPMQAEMDRLCGHVLGLFIKTYTYPAERGIPDFGELLESNKRPYCSNNGFDLNEVARRLYGSYVMAYDVAD